MHHTRGHGHVCQHCRLEEVALVADAITARLNGSTFLCRIAGERFHRTDPARIRHWTHPGGRVHAVPDLQRLGATDKAFDELVVNLFLDREPRG